MEARRLPQGKPIVPADFSAPLRSRGRQENLLPPSHFERLKSAAVPKFSTAGPSVPTSWITTGVTPPACQPAPDAPRSHIAQGQKDIVEPQRLSHRGRTIMEDTVVVDLSPDYRITRCTNDTEQCSRRETEWQPEVENLKAEALSLRGQLRVMGDTAERHREEMRDKDRSLSRQRREMEAMCTELLETKAEICQLREELEQSERQKRESGDEIARLKKEAERNKEEMEKGILALDEAKRQSGQLRKLQMDQGAKMEEMKAKHHLELETARQRTSQLQEDLDSVKTERDRLQAQLSRVAQDFETQSATLHSFRNYVDQLGLDNGETNRLRETVQSLSIEKDALRKTAELLRAQVRAMTEIVSLQEETLLKRESAELVMSEAPKAVQLLHLWREKVFSVKVQLFSKDMVQKGERAQYLSAVRDLEERLQQEQHQVSVLQLKLDGKLAELHLESVEKERLENDLADTHRENQQLKSQAEAQIQTVMKLTERFKQAFESKVEEVEAAQARLNTFSQRLSFAKWRVETLPEFMTKTSALREIEEANRRAEEAASSAQDLQSELMLVREERDKLSQELTKTPALIEEARADLRQQYEMKLKRQQQELEQELQLSAAEARRAEAGRQEAECSLQQSQAQLRESQDNLGKLLQQQEQSEQALKERVFEVEKSCAEKLTEMGARVKASRTEHTKAVMALMECQRQLVRTRDKERDACRPRRDGENRAGPSAQPKDAQRDEDASSCETGTKAATGGRAMRSECEGRTALENSADRCVSAAAQAQPRPNEAIRSMLGDLRTLNHRLLTEVYGEEEAAGQQHTK